MDENTQVKFDEKMKELLAVAKKKKNVLEYQEIADHFTDIVLEEDQFEKILEKYGLRYDDLSDRELRYINASIG